MNHALVPAAPHPPSPFGLIGRAAFWSARHLAPSPWLEVLPFVFWLVEVLRPRVALALEVDDGVGFLGLCQAVDRLALPGRCVALVDPEARLPDAVAWQLARFYPDLADTLAGGPDAVAPRIGPGALDLVLAPSAAAAGPALAALADALSAQAVIVVPGSDGAAVAGGRPVLDLGAGAVAVLAGAAPAPVLARLAEGGPDAAEALALRAVLRRLGAAHRLELAAAALPAGTAPDPDHTTALAAERAARIGAEARAAELAAALEAARASLRRRFEEIATLTRVIEGATTHAPAAAGETAPPAAAPRPAPALPRAALLRNLAAAHKRIRTAGDDAFVAHGLPSLAAQLEALRRDPLLDAGWYHKTYPDVAAAGMEPALHYLHAGTYEGRNPGPRFDTLAHYAAHPDAVRLGLCALIHLRRLPAAPAG